MLCASRSTTPASSSSAIRRLSFKSAVLTAVTRGMSNVDRRSSPRCASRWLLRRQLTSAFRAPLQGVPQASWRAYARYVGSLSSPTAGWAGAAHARLDGPGDWTTDYPAASSFFDAKLSCRAFGPASPLSNNDAEFCYHGIERVAERARRLASTDPHAAVNLWEDVYRRTAGAVSEQAVSLGAVHPRRSAARARLRTGAPRARARRRQGLGQRVGRARRQRGFGRPAVWRRDGGGGADRVRRGSSSRTWRG